MECQPEGTEPGQSPSAGRPGPDRPSSALRAENARLRAEIADLRNRQARGEDSHRRILEGIPAAVFVTQVESRVVEFVNRAGVELLGASEPDEIVGRSLLDFVHPDDRVDAVERGVRAARGEPVARVSQGRLIRLDGTEVVVERSVSHGTYRGMPILQSVLHDITARVRVERALEISESRFRDFAEAASDWYWETDAAGRFTFVSERFAEVTGVEASEILGKTQDAMLAGSLPDDELAQEQKWARFGETLAARCPYRDFAYRWTDREGGLRALSSSAVPVLGANGTFRGYRGVGRDLTVEDATRRALDDERERLARAEATASLGNWEWRLDTGAVLWSSGMYAIAGVDPDRFAVDLESATGVFAEQDLPAIRNLMRLTLKTHEPFSYRARIVRPGGEVRHVVVTGECEADRTGRVELVFGVVQDVTERERAEALLHDAVASIPDGFAIYDKDGRLVLFNDAYRDGAHRAQDLIRPGLLFEDLTRACVERGAFADEWTSRPEWLEQRLARRREPGRPIELEFSDGRWFEIRESRTREGGTLAFHTDITARKRAERELARHRERLLELVDERTRELADAQAELLRAERLAAIGEVTATVSHELRNPLGTMRTSVYVLEQRLEGADPSTRRLFERIERSVERCVTIIEELLAYTRVRPLVRERRRLGAWCRSVLGEVESPQGVDLTVDVQSDAEASFDDERLQQALLNLVQNAFQAFEDDEGRRGGTVCVRVTTRDGRHELRVEDDGAGISPDALERVFEPLFSTRPFGIGLGLPVVRQAMEQHGGGVAVETGPAGGTQAVLWLPSESG